MINQNNFNNCNIARHLSLIVSPQTRILGPQNQNLPVSNYRNLCINGGDYPYDNLSCSPVWRIKMPSPIQEVGASPPRSVSLLLATHLSSHFHFHNEQELKKRQLIFLHTFTTTGAEKATTHLSSHFHFHNDRSWKSDNLFVFTLSLLQWPELKKRQLICLHTLKKLVAESFCLCEWTLGLLRTTSCACSSRSGG